MRDRHSHSDFKTVVPHQSHLSSTCTCCWNPLSKYPDRQRIVQRTFLTFDGDLRNDERIILYNNHDI